MTDQQQHHDEYTPEILAVLQLLWGDGFLSPGGEAHLDEIVKGLDLRDRLVLDIGCALGGFDILLAKKFGARVIGLDVEAPLIEHAKGRVTEAGLADRVDLRHCDPGPLPLPDAEFDVVFGKDSWIHIEDKRGFFAEVYRVLKPGGILAAGDWLRSDRPYNDDMYYFFELEGLTYHMDTLDSYGHILTETGFVDVQLTDIHDEYRAMAHDEYQKLQTSLAGPLTEMVGQEWQTHFVENWRAIVVVLDNGDLRPGRLRARKPG
jgi:phosphoethanolamine N-methyltransferase